MTSEWDNTLTWNTAMNGDSLPGQISDDVLDSNCIDATEKYTWNITSLVKQWYSGEVSNYGVCWKTIDETNDYISFDSSQAS